MRQADGRKDPLVQRLQALHNEAGRLKHGAYFIEGAELVRRAMDFGASLEAILLTPAFARTEEGAHLLDKAAAGRVESCAVSPGLLASVLGAKPTPDCVAILVRRTVSIAEAVGGSNALVQMVENGESADNLGMLMRTVDAAGATGVILAGATVDPFNRRTVRGSRGAVFTMPVCG
jgi:TrmH family RNA methyltransferase